MEISVQENGRILEVLQELEALGLVRISSFDEVEQHLDAITKMRPWQIYGKYSDYLLSQEWNDLREAALEYHGRECQICGQRHDLQVHHISYENGVLAKVEDLAVLCKTCHGKLHKAIANIESENHLLVEITKGVMGGKIAAAINSAFFGIEGRRKQVAVKIIRNTWHNKARSYRLPDNYDVIMQNVKKI